MNRPVALLALAAFVLTLNGCPALGNQSNGGANTMTVSPAKSAAKSATVKSKKFKSNNLQNNLNLLNEQKLLQASAQKNAKKNFSGASKNNAPDPAPKKLKPKQKTHPKHRKIKKKTVLHN